MSGKRQKRAIILLSGGLDSSTVLAYVNKHAYRIFALSFAYGQRNKFELQKAKLLAEKYKADEHKIIEVDLGTFTGSSLTSDLEVEKNRDFSEIGSSIPSTYVPLRNTIFISYALAWAEVLEISDIFIGVNSIDHSGYPDCRPEYIKAFNKLANLACKISIQDGIEVSIHTPLIDMNKSEIIKMGLELGLDYSLTETCYDPDVTGLACGVCDSCKLRQKAFFDLGMKDPLSYKRALQLNV